VIGISLRSKLPHGVILSRKADRPRKYLQDIQGQEEADRGTDSGITQEERISRSTLENDARESTLHGHGTPEERFWQRQQGRAESIIIGKSYISKVCHCPPV
jgi:anoctamin-10